jgi:hypothetical protein
MIMPGDLKAGEQVQEIPLSMALGVSRTPIREALVVLAHEGLLVSGTGGQAGRANYVASYINGSVLTVDGGFSAGYATQHGGADLAT